MASYRGIEIVTDKEAGLAKSGMGTLPCCGCPMLAHSVIDIDRKRSVAEVWCVRCHPDASIERPTHEHGVARLIGGGLWTVDGEAGEASTACMEGICRSCRPENVSAGVCLHACHDATLGQTMELSPAQLDLIRDRQCPTCDQPGAPLVYNVSENRWACWRCNYAWVAGHPPADLRHRAINVTAALAPVLAILERNPVAYDASRIWKSDELAALLLSYRHDLDSKILKGGRILAAELHQRRADAIDAVRLTGTHPEAPDQVLTEMIPLIWVGLVKPDNPAGHRFGNLAIIGGRLMGRLRGEGEWVEMPGVHPGAPGHPDATVHDDGRTVRFDLLGAPSTEKASSLDVKVEQIQVQLTPEQMEILAVIREKLVSVGGPDGKEPTAEIVSSQAGPTPPRPITPEELRRLRADPVAFLRSIGMSHPAVSGDIILEQQNQQNRKISMGGHVAEAPELPMLMGQANHEEDLIAELEARYCASCGDSRPSAITMQPKDCGHVQCLLCCAETEVGDRLPHAIMCPDGDTAPILRSFLLELRGDRLRSALRAMLRQRRLNLESSDGQDSLELIRRSTIHPDLVAAAEGAHLLERLTRKKSDQLIQIFAGEPGVVGRFLVRRGLCRLAVPDWQSVKGTPPRMWEVAQVSGLEQKEATEAWRAEVADWNHGQALEAVRKRPLPLCPLGGKVTARVMRDARQSSDDHVRDVAYVCGRCSGLVNSVCHADRLADHPRAGIRRRRGAGV